MSKQKEKLLIDENLKKKQKIDSEVISVEDFPIKNSLSFDFGSFQSIFGYVTKDEYFKETNTFPSILQFFIENDDVNCKYPKESSALMKKNDYKHIFLNLKSLLGTEKLTLYQNKNEIKVKPFVLLECAFKTYLDKLKEYKVNMNDYNIFLFSYPNFFTYYQLLNYKKVVQNALDIKKWKGESYFYSESDAFLFARYSHLSNHGKLNKGKYLSIVHGYYYTNVTLSFINDEDEIDLRNEGYDIGEHCLIQQISEYFKKNFELSHEDFKEIVIYYYSDLKDLVLNSSEEKFEFFNYVLERSDMEEIFLNHYKLLNDEIGKFLNSNFNENSPLSQLNEIILCGKSLENTKQKEYLLNNAFKDVEPHKIIFNSIKNQIVKGLHYRHFYNPEKIIETNSYAIYLKNEEKDEFYCILNLGSSLFKNRNILTVKNQKKITFKLFQIFVDRLDFENENEMEFFNANEEFEDLVFVCGSLTVEIPKEKKQKEIPKEIDLIFGAEIKDKNIHIKSWMIKNDQEMSLNTEFLLD